MLALTVENGVIALDRKHPRPTPGEGEALLRVHLAGVCRTDIEILRGYMSFRGVPGHEFVATVEESPDPALKGQRVVGEINCVCGSCPFCRDGLSNHCPNRTVLGIAGRDGAFAEYLTLPVRNLHVTPATLSDDEAVFVEPLAAAFRILGQVRVEKGMRIALLGDGRLGMLVGQVLMGTGCALHAFGHHKEHLDFLAQRGAEIEEDTKRLRKSCDVVVECTGSESGLRDAMMLVRPSGTIVLKSTIVPGRADSAEPMDLSPLVVDEVSVIGSRCGPFRRALEALCMKEVSVLPLISARYPLAEAPRALEHASRRGTLKVLIDCCSAQP